MIAIVDLQTIGRDHIPFNTAYLRLQRRIAGAEEIVMVCRPDHQREIAAVLAETGIEFVAVPEQLHCPPTGLLKAFDERGQDCFIRDLCRERRVARLVLLGVRADLLDRIRMHPPAPAVDIIFHATLAEPAKWRARNPLRRRLDMFGILSRRFPPAVRLIFLEEGIAALTDTLVAPDSSRGLLPHPIPSEPVLAQRPIDPARINVGFIGESQPGKGFEHFVKLARNRPPHLRLHCVGRRARDYDEAFDALFDSPPARDKLSQEDYDEKTRANDIIFLPLDPIWYDLVASGSLLDCIRFGIPPVIVRNAVTDAIERRYGRFGYSVDTAVQGIDLLRTMPAHRYAADLPQFRHVLYRIAMDRTVDSLARAASLNCARPWSGRGVDEDPAS